MNHKLGHRIVSILLSVLMLVSLLPMASVAEGGVAQIDSTTYPTLAAAIAAVPTTGVETTITMIADDTFTGNAGVTIPATKNVILDLNGHTITGVATTAAASQTILNNGHLTIDDTSTSANGLLTNTGLTEEEAGDWWSDPQKDYANNVILNKGTLVVENGTIAKGIIGNICYVIDTYSNSSVEINGGTVGNDTTGSAMRIANGYSGAGAVSVTVNGGTVKTDTNYYAIWNQYLGDEYALNFTMNGGRIIGSIYDSGGTNNLTYTFTGGVIDGIIKSYGAKFVISDGANGAPVFNGYVKNQYYAYNANYSTTNTMNISGGIFNGEVYIYQYTDTNDNISVTGGKFAGEYEKIYALYYDGEWCYTPCVSGGIYTDNEYVYENKTYTCGWVRSIVDGYCDVPNMDTATKADYPRTVGIPVAQIGDTYYASLADAFAAVPTDGTETTVTMLCDYEIPESASNIYGVKVLSGQNIVLDLGAYTVSGTSDTHSNAHQHYALIDNCGTLTVKGTGKITYQGVADSSFSNFYMDTILNQGTLNVTSGTIENTTATGMICAAIDNNSTVAAPVVNVTGGTVVAARVAIRQFANSTTKTNTVNISGGLVQGGRDAVMMQGSSSNSSGLADLNVSGGELKCTTSGKGIIQYWDQAYAAKNGTALTVNVTDGTFTGDTLFELDPTDMTSADLQKGIDVSGGIYQVKVSDDYLAALKVCDTNNDTATNATYLYTVKDGGEIIVNPTFDDDNGAKTELVVVDYNPSEVETFVKPADMTEEEQTAVSEKTNVSGVELTKPTEEKTTGSGLQQVIEKAKKESTDVKNAIEANKDKVINVKVDVDVKVVTDSYVKTETANSITFDLTPKATVTVTTKETGKDDVVVSVDNVSVTNDMIDQTQDISVDLYTGFKPAQIVHKDHEGNVIEIFGADDFTYNSTTGVATVIIHQFSTLTAVRAESGEIENLIVDAYTDSGYYGPCHDSNDKTGIIAYSAQIDLDKVTTGEITGFGMYFYCSETGVETLTNTNANEIAALKANEGWIYGFVDGIDVDNFDDTVYCIPFIVVNGAIVIQDGFSISANVSAKPSDYLGTNSPVPAQK